MFKKMMKHLVNNPGLKVLSLLLSIVLWMIVVKMADPDDTKSFSVPVEILNKDVIMEMGKVADVVDDTDIAVFYITGPRSYVEKMDSSDFSVTADLSQVDLSQDGDTKLVPIEITAKKNEKWISIIKRTVNMRIALEDLSEQKFVISPETTGTPAEGCAIGTVEVIPNLLKVSGPESIVSRINRVAATINVDGISGDVSDSVIPVLYDEDGKVISSDLLELNQNTVTIRANILGTKSVPVRCQVSGTPAEGYEYRGLEYAPETVLIKGEALLLNGIDAIDIPEDVINIEGKKEDVEVTVDIKPYLEEAGISLVDETSSQIAIKALIEQKETKTFHLPVEKIQVNGLNQDYEIAYTGNTVSVSVRALKEYMETLQTENIQAVLDVSDLAPGTHTLELEITLPDERFELTGSVSLQVTIEDKNAEPEEPEVEQDENEAEEASTGAQQNNGSQDRNDQSDTNDQRNNSDQNDNQNNREDEEVD
ncbi:MAG: hypothetical protein HFH41_05570 [Lachnospiraceae bacterium]|nr:hypothetical protein [Lachnospiraceae bacterium]